MNDYITRIINVAGTNGPKYGVPTLIGRPQTGKTTLLKRLAYESGAHVCILNPALDLPEDLGGFPIARNGKVAYTRPPVLPEGDATYWIIVDELDKPRRDVQVALLTLFAERRIRNTAIPDHWPIVCAMNEPRMELEPALVERLLFIPFDQQPVFASGSLNRIPRRWLPAEASVRIPERDGSARGSAWRLDAWAQTPEWRVPEIREILCRGLLNEQAAAIALAEFDSIEPKPQIDPVEWMKTRKYTEIVPELCVILCSLERDAFGQVLLAWQERIDADKTGEWQRLLNLWNEHEVGKDKDGKTMVVRDLTIPGGNGLEAQRHMDAAVTKVPKGKK